MALLHQRRSLPVERDRLQKVALCVILEGNADVAQDLATVMLVIKKRAGRLVAASRAGLIDCPTGTVETLGLALGDAATATWRATRAVMVVLGLAPHKSRAEVATRDPSS